MAPGDECVIVYTTVAGEEVARELSGRIVDARAAACVQSMPIRSLYRWHGKVESASEYLLAAKTTAKSAAGLVRLIREHHAYELPEIVVTPIAGGYQPYLDWIAAETAPQPPAQ